MLLLALLLQTGSAARLPAVDRPGSGAGVTSAIAAACPAAASLGDNALLRLEVHEADSAATGHSAGAWARLGCTRALLGERNLLSHAGPLMIAGNSWIEGALRSLMQALQLAPGDSVAARTLALLALDQEDLGREEAPVDSALFGAIDAGVSDATVLDACTTLARRVSNDARLRSCAERDLATGRDSTWNDIALSRLAFRHADTASGMKLFLAAVGAAHDSASLDAVGWQLQWFLTPDQVNDWSELSDVARVVWVRQQLIARDVRDGQPLGATLAEHFKRLDFAEANFGLEVPARLRAAVQTMPATPDPFAGLPNTDSLMLDSGDAGAVAARPMRDYLRWQADLDDRAVVWMRYGKPDKRVSWMCPGASCFISREAWLYKFGDRQFIVNFENESNVGSSEPTRLVSGVIGEYFCGLDVKRCLLAERSHMGAIVQQRHLSMGDSSVTGNPGLASAVERVRAEDEQAIRLATTTDDNAVRGEKAIATEAHLHRLWDPATGAPIALTTYAMRLGDLATAKAESITAATVAFAIRQFVADSGSWSETSVTRHLLLPRGHGKDAQVTGFLVTPSSPAVTDWSVVASQPDRLGRSYHLGGEGLEPGPLMISDLVLGSAAQGVAWQSSGQRVVLAPLDAIDLHQPMTLYYQVRSTVPHAAANTTVVLYRVAGDTVSAAPALQVVFHGAISQGLNEVDNTVDVSRLEKGTYRLQVRIYAGPAALTERSTTLELRERS